MVPHKTLSDYGILENTRLPERVGIGEVGATKGGQMPASCNKGGSKDATIATSKNQLIRFWRPAWTEIDREKGNGREQL
ncbi:hypothetical protein HNY73_011833 [Argiope bruennichi]|uniref:Uncharacterized protein n=1 Tax=Argiope bruennichi TaxID=94029 RepID=A0A8T0ETM7_ARGBR|nr:hypothetical protein HNY73_011833 [Argiope bruennichi]